MIFTSFILFSLLFSCSVMSDSLQPYGLQQTRPPCPSPSSGVCPSSCLLCQWCHLASSSSDTLFFLLLSIFPSNMDFSSESSVVSKYWSFSISPFSEYSGRSPLRLTGLISLLSKGHSGVFSRTTVRRCRFFGILPFYVPALTTTHDHWEDHSLDYMNLCWQSNVSAFPQTD